MKVLTKNGKVTPWTKTRYVIASRQFSTYNFNFKLLDELEPVASAGGIILDWHTCDIFPERWIDLVVVLRCDHTVLWERLEERLVQLRFSCFLLVPHD